MNEFFSLFIGFSMFDHTKIRVDYRKRLIDFNTACRRNFSDWLSREFFDLSEFFMSITKDSTIGIDSPRFDDSSEKFHSFGDSWDEDLEVIEIIKTLSSEESIKEEILYSD